MGRLDYTIHPDPAGARVVLEGVLDEATNLTGLLEELSPDRDVVLDLRGIQRVNSIGLKRWISAMEELTARQPVVVEICSVTMAFQATMVMNIFAGADVLSCQAPYFCPRCQKTLALIVTRQEVRGSPDAAPDKPCPECGGAAELDELEAFLDFMR